MKTIKTTLSLLFVLFYLKANAEVTNGTINVYYESKKEIAFKLFDNVKIECGDPEGKWISMVIYLPSTKALYKPNIKLKKGYSLIDSTGKKIGYVVSDSIDITPLYSKSQNLYQMRFAGYITINDIRSLTVPENVLQQLINSNSNNLNFDSFKKFIADFGLRYYKDEMDKKYPPNKSYVLWHDTYVVSDAVFRFQLIFNKDKLVAILHSRKLNIVGFKDTKLQKNYLLWTKNKNEKEMNGFINTYHKIYEVLDEN
ncbi:MAG TPA: hypothetical protein VNX40_04605 [Mucilaginibacter sp.]|jgi:hypothetical protein|nr:hypothetical protein [Mucilaginibacter sp.]